MFEDTIAAISTALGRAAIALVRVSGREVSAISTAVGLNDLVPRRAAYRALRHPKTGRELDRVLATRFVAPASYTGEDLIEISCHGGVLVPRLVLDAVLAAGARPAEPGEFARRAFLNGKLDLVQVEATLDLVDAKSEALARAAVFQMEGGLSRRVASIRERVVKLQAMLGYEIDFPEDHEAPIPLESVVDAAEELISELDALLRHAPEGELLREGALTVIAGRTNAGKSSLFNALIGSSRAIVTEVPGTTRDAIEALISVEGYPFRLVDTAGLREEPEYVEGLGIEVAKRYLDQAQLVLYCSEAGKPLTPMEAQLLDRWRSEGRQGACVRTKADLLAEPPSEASSASDWPEVQVSVVSGGGLDDLQKTLLETVYGGLRTSGDAPLLIRRRQIRGVCDARGHLVDFRNARVGGVPAEMCCVHLQDATLALEELVGIVDREEVLDVLFSSFCVGK